jgi:hypothetical protein
MQPTNTITITKSDFLLYCEAPRHLWAKKHGQIESFLSDFEQHFAEEGTRVEALAHVFLADQFPADDANCQLQWQPTFRDGPFEARLDALVFKPASGTYDLYEIKSSTGVDKEIVYDVAFQAAILATQIPVDHYYVLHLNKEYIRRGELDLASLFIAEDITEKVISLLPTVEALRQQAWQVTQMESMGDAEYCYNPKTCPCPTLCHPDLPAFSIFDIPRLSKDKKADLLAQGIRAACDIPLAFAMSDKQQAIAQLARTNREHIDRAAIAAELGQLIFPLYFLDYETCISALPLYDGYHPQQQVVFQYSLHRLEQPGGELTHCEFIATGIAEPTWALLQQLQEDIGDTGTVISWNKSFEMTCNRAMALLHSNYADFLASLNNRFYDLADIITKGYYLHPGFKGSWSIKPVLPVMVPALSYEGLAINKGDQASMAWWKIQHTDIDPAEKDQLVRDLLRYCDLDTLAMVEIYRRFLAIIQ